MVKAKINGRIEQNRGYGCYFIFFIIMSEKHICCGYNKAKGMTGILFKAHHKDFFKCNAVAKFNEGDKWYCKRHLPSAIKIRDEKRWQTYINKINNGLEINKTVN